MAQARSQLRDTLGQKPFTVGGLETFWRKIKWDNMDLGHSVLVSLSVREHRHS